jgi:hypothetical protein
MVPGSRRIEALELVVESVSHSFDAAAHRHEIVLPE